jgi:hypothetical protein
MAKLPEEPRQTLTPKSRLIRSCAFQPGQTKTNLGRAMTANQERETETAQAHEG